MTKEDKIKEEWDNLLPFIPKGGYSLIDGYSNELYHQVQEPINYAFFDYEKVTINSGKIRPKSLQGIETNNSWIKIESEEDLPKEDCECFYIPKRSNKVVVGCFRLKSYKGWKNMFTVDDNIALGFGKVTHYQPLEKPKPPIY